MQGNPMATEEPIVGDTTVELETLATEDDVIEAQEEDAEGEAAEILPLADEDDGQALDQESSAPGDSEHNPGLQPRELPTIATLKTRFAPSISRLDNLLNAVQANSLPVVSASSEYQDFPQPREDIEDPAGSTVGERLTTLSTAAFWKRVDSFSSYGWFGKPLAVSPLECARFGWKLHSADTLGCTFCKKQLIYSNSDPAQLVSYTLKYIELLQSAHNDECPFKTKAISQAVYSLQTRPSSVIVSRFYERLYLLHKALPQQPQITEGELNLEVQELLKYGDTNGVNLEDICDQIPGGMPSSLIYLALCGWTSNSRSTNSSGAFSSIPSSKSDTLSIRCLHCRRNVKVNFSAPALPIDYDAEQGPSVKKAKLIESTPVDPLLDHKLYCPWVNIVQGEQHFGWQLSLRAIVLSLQSSAPSPSFDADSTATTRSEDKPPATETLQERLSRTLQRVQSLADL